MTKRENGLLDLELNTGDKMTDVDCLLWAVGRVPLSENIGLDKLVSICLILFNKIIKPTEELHNNLLHLIIE